MDIKDSKKFLVQQDFQELKNVVDFFTFKNKRKKNTEDQTE